MRATDRGKEAYKRSIGVATGSDNRQNCEVTDRNLIQGRYGQASGPNITKPFSFIRIGKSSACAVKVNRPIQGGLASRSGSRLYAESRSQAVKTVWRLQQSAEAIVLTRHIPLATGRAEL